jgi:selenocysteine lyase/cysteine desulfurase
MNWQQVRAQFPITQEYLFFDLANKCALPLFATRAVHDYVAKQQTFSGDKDEWFRTIEEARARTAQLLHVQPDEIAFTKNTSEGLNIAANGIPFKAGDNVVVNLSEHPNNIYCWLNLEQRGVEVRWAPTKDGEVRVEDLATVVDGSTRAVAIAHVTYAPGNRNDLKAICDFCRARGILVVVDAVQSVGTLQVDAPALGVDMLCTSGHKALFVPHGLGVLSCRKTLIPDIRPMYVARSGMLGAASVEHDSQRYVLRVSPTGKGYEIGNYNYLAITVLNESLRFLLGIGMPAIERRILDLSGSLTARLEGAGFQVLSPRDEGRRSAIVCFQAADPARLHAWLMERRVITTCRRDSLRLSLGIYNTEEEIDAFVRLVRQHQA